MQNQPHTPDIDTASPVATLIDAARALLRQEGDPQLSQLSALALNDLGETDAGLFDPAGLAGAMRALWQQARHAPLPSVMAMPTQSGRQPASVLTVIQRDRPFLIDSLTALLQNQGCELITSIHPVLAVARDAHGAVTQLAAPATAPDMPKESWAQLFFSAAPDRLADITHSTQTLLTQIAAVVDDWAPMRAQLQAARAGMMPSDREAADLLGWLDAEHFTYLGVRDYRLGGTPTAPVLQPQAEDYFGLFRQDPATLGAFADFSHTIPPEVTRFLADAPPMLIAKTQQRATVHRPVPMDAFFVKLYDTSGKLAGLRLIVGLLTSLAYSRNARDIPVVRQKVAEVLRRSGFDAVSHNGKALLHVLDTYPRDELFQASTDDLLRIATGVVRLQERRQVSVFVRRDPFNRYVSCLVYVPREAFDTGVRQRLLDELARSFGGPISHFDLALSQNPMVRLHAIVNTTPETADWIDLHALGSRLIEICRTWSERLQMALVAQQGERDGTALAARYQGGFDALYRDSVTPDQALDDIAVLNQMQDGRAVAVRLTQQGKALSFKVYNRQRPLDLSKTLPTLANLGLAVRIERGPFQLTLPNGTAVWLHDYEAADPALALSPHSTLVEDAFLAALAGTVEDDRFNRLVLVAGLAWREADVLRALAKYLRQIGMAVGLNRMADLLTEHAAASRLLIAAFKIKFDPGIAGDRPAQLKAACQELTDYIRNVPDLDADRLLSSYTNLLEAALRTNYFQDGGTQAHKPYLSIKFRSATITNMPKPVPFAEIWVHSPRTEGVHLRGGKVARGGIRWSDRRDDFRTEVLGLMKAQVVKNTVIVPTGSKGGFYVKHGASTDAKENAVASYRELICGLLDLTDNYHGTTVVTPPRTVRYDEDDPYLVVAADKGTATFSDIANGISLDYSFWLGDAFASGGSVGYDHKEMGITARGAWESVKRHFRELGTDTQTQPFTITGVGDMAGDVFGNGLLLSPAGRLVAAFNYAHIFLDPDPDTARAFAERERLFHLGRGSWDQYDTSLISTGGGVWPRTQKSIPLSYEARELLGIEAEQLAPDDLMRAILSMPADLLYFGGIGTYIRAPDETDAEVGDKANDALRVDAAAIRAKVIGEGANLGITQRGRIALCQRGVRLNTDAIDNSAGVDTSDHEVNIKILIAELLADGTVTPDTRESMLKGLTDQVAALVLRDNYLQTQALTLAEARAPDLLASQQAFMARLESESMLDRGIEFLPDTAELTRRVAARQGLTRAELAVLLAYGKIWLDRQLLRAPLLTEAALQPELASYFPPALARHTAAVQAHRLAREITATVLTNELVNRLGPAGVPSLSAETGTSAESIARAYLIARDAFAFPSLWQAIEALDNQVPAKTQTMMQLSAQRALEQAIQALLSRRHDQSSALPDHTSDIVAERLLQREAYTALVQWLQGAGGETDAFALLPDMRSGSTSLPDALLAQLRLLGWLPLLPRLSFTARASGEPLARIIPVFAAVDARLQLRRLSQQLNRQLSHATLGAYETQALHLLESDLQQSEQQLAGALVQAGTGDLDSWLQQSGRTLARYDELAAALRAPQAVQGQPDLGLWTLLGRELQQLAQS